MAVQKRSADSFDRLRRSRPGQSCARRAGPLCHSTDDRLDTHPWAMTISRYDGDSQARIEGDALSCGYRNGTAKKHSITLAGF
jgi:hypothetical protein